MSSGNLVKGRYMGGLLMDDRRSRILEQLASDGSVQVSDLAHEFDVSYETIRKDLAFLEERGYLVKTHGGAMLKQNAIEYPFHVREKENVEEKRAVARRALELIPEESSIIVGTGSTMLVLAKLLATRSGHKIFTHSLTAMAALIESDNQVYLFGGELRSRSSSVYGGWTVSQIRQIHVDLCFMGTDGFSNLDGPSSPSLSAAFVDQEIIASSEKRYVLADQSKFYRKSLCRICDWSEITALVTNEPANSDSARLLARKTNVISCAEAS